MGTKDLGEAPVPVTRQGRQRNRDAVPDEGDRLPVFFKVVVTVFSDSKLSSLLLEQAGNRFVPRIGGLDHQRHPDTGRGTLSVQLVLPG
jgi:hypothetical protein